MTAKANKQSVARRGAGRRLMEVIKRYDLNLRVVSRETGVDLVTLKNLQKFTPHLNTIERVSIYLEQVARKAQSGIDRSKIKEKNLAKAKAQQAVLIAQKIAASKKTYSASGATRPKKVEVT